MHCFYIIQSYSNRLYTKINVCIQNIQPKRRTVTWAYTLKTVWARDHTTVAWSYNVKLGWRRQQNHNNKAAITRKLGKTDRSLKKKWNFSTHLNESPVKNISERSRNEFCTRFLHWYKNMMGMTWFICLISVKIISWQQTYWQSIYTPGGACIANIVFT